MNHSLNESFSSKINLTLNNCEKLQTFENIIEFFHCYEYFFSKSSYRSIVHWIIILGSIFFNGLVMILTSISSSKFSVFDQILFGHCIIDGLTGFVDIPLFHVNDIFGYWPFGNIASLAWTIYDNNINTSTSLHMAYASYARLRSIQNPKGYTREIMFRKPYIIMILIWTVDLIIWSIISLLFNIKDYTINIDFKPTYLISVFNLLLWLVPLFLILFLSVHVYNLLRIREIRRKLITRKLKLSCTMNTALSIITSGSLKQNNGDRSKTNNHRSKRPLLFRLFHLSAKTKFSILMGSYLLQWFPPCLLSTISPYIIQHIDETLISTIYWLTYSVCMTDPIFILVLNPNVSCFKTNKLTKIR